MYPASFDYKRPATIDEAVALLTEHGDDAKVLAGGHSLIPAMKLRMARPAVVVDIGRISNLNDIREAGNGIAIGAMTTHQQVASSKLLQDKCPLLPETASHIGDVQVRNMGTIGGSLAHADPAADYPAAILALDAEIDVVGPNGKRTIRAGEFFVDLMTTALAERPWITPVVMPTARDLPYAMREIRKRGVTRVSCIGGRQRTGVTSQMSFSKELRRTSTDTSKSCIWRVGVALLDHVVGRPAPGRGDSGKVKWRSDSGGGNPAAARICSLAVSSTGVLSNVAVCEF